MKKIKNIVKFFIVLVFLFVLFNLFGYVYAYFVGKIDIKSANSFYIYDSNDSLFVGGNEEEWVSYNDIGDMIIKATVSTEDKNFFHHSGFDYLRILKAMYENILSGEIVQGASTISQQYAKNLFLDFDKTWSRKWKEMWLTFRLEGFYTKEEIIEGYLNTINYGNGVYGIANASKYYFNKDLDALSLAEVSMLVGIPNSPENYSPVSNYESAKRRQKVVLERMLSNGYISDSEYSDACNEEVIIYGIKDNYDLSSIMYYKDAVMEELSSIDTIPKSYLETGGLKVYTVFDEVAQASLENSLSYMDDNVQIARVMINPNDGGVIGLIGGKDYSSSTYNRALYSYRQPGSTIKPFLYYKALEDGFTSSSTFLSQITTFNFDGEESYSPKNSGNIYAGKEISMASAIAYSDNIYAVKTHLFIGRNKLVDILKTVGITSNLDSSPSLPLGSYEVNILELASAYASFANLGKIVKPYFIEKVTDINGNILYEYKMEDNTFLDSSLVYIINELLTSTYDSNMISYTYPTCINMLSILTGKYSIKSGSTDTDAWVVGYNKDAVVVSWAGHDDNSLISSSVVSSNKISFAHILEDYFKDKNSEWYKMPSDVVGVLTDGVSGELANSDTKNKKILYYIKGTEPSH